ncbi:hypothetical protein BSKO_08998 [Bryopsis sp. KO-2023]|nr:hypothetical protein BSKO_08998 [Bryopsis sp. KO-2023]
MVVSFFSAPTNPKEIIGLGLATLDNLLTFQSPCFARTQAGRNRGSSSARSCSPETYESPSPFERAQALMRNKTAWNAPMSDDKDDSGLRSSRTASSRPPSSLGGRSTLSSSRTVRSIASSRTSSGVTRGTSLTRASSRAGSKASDKKASPASRLRQTGSSVAAQQKAKTRERAFKARAEDFTRAIRSLDGGCRVTKPRLEEPDFAGAEGVPSLEPFADLQAGVMERWKAAKETAKAALEAVIEAEKMMEFLSEFWITTDNLKKRRWDAGVDGFLALNGAVEKEFAPSEDEGHQEEPSGVPAKVKTDAGAETIAERQRESVNVLNTCRSGGSASSSSSGSPKGDATVSPCEDSSCTPTGKSWVSSGATSPSSNDVSHPFGGTLAQWSAVDPSPGHEACVTYYHDIRSLGPRFQSVSETWFLTVIESAFVLRGRRGVYSREDCCTLLNTLSKVQDWLEAEPVKTRVSQTHPHDIRLLVRDTVIHWGSQLFILPSAAS